MLGANVVTMACGTKVCSNLSVAIGADVADSAEFNSAFAYVPSLPPADMPCLCAHALISSTVHTTALQNPAAFAFDEACFISSFGSAPRSRSADSSDSSLCAAAAAAPAIFVHPSFESPFAMHALVASATASGLRVELLCTAEGTGAKVGTKVTPVGRRVGDKEGWRDGAKLGTDVVVLDGESVGFMVGLATSVGTGDRVQEPFGTLDGKRVGSNDGTIVGMRVGAAVGAVGVSVGLLLKTTLGGSAGCRVGFPVRSRVGCIVGSCFGLAVRGSTRTGP